jgi:RNA polymerase sigma-70 factor (ECF subfamily)
MSDKQKLIQLLRNKDDTAACLLGERFGSRLYVAARLLCGNEADAQDLVSETIQRAFYSIGSYREKSSLFCWLYGILLNVSRMIDRKARQSPVVYVACLPEVAEDGAAVGQASDRVALANCLAAAVKKLSSDQQDVIFLRYFGELTVREIADSLQLSSGTVKSRLYYALRHLKKHLPEEMNRFGERGVG